VARKGAYRRFKDLLDSAGLLEEWYGLEDAILEKALRDWCEENDIDMVDAPGAPHALNGVRRDRLLRPKKKEPAMHPYPHRYAVAATADPEGDVALQGDRLPPLASAPPAEFDGPGDRWSPETLLVAAVADCFVLTFRAIARASKFPWLSLHCEVEGALDRVERVTQFTGFRVRARLRLPAGGNEEQARRLMERAEQTCLVTNSLKAATQLEAEVEWVAAPAGA
jgi:organic hydroperoxide reductase OsmC/OhrA